MSKRNTLRRHILELVRQYHAVGTSAPGMAREMADEESAVYRVTGCVQGLPWAASA